MCRIGLIPARGAAPVITLGLPGGVFPPRLPLASNRLRYAMVEKKTLNR
jgi:hypothetical protein